MQQYRIDGACNVLVVKYTSKEVLDLSIDWSLDKDIGDTIIRHAQQQCRLSDVPHSTQLTINEGRFCVYMEVSDDTEAT